MWIIFSPAVCCIRFLLVDSCFIDCFRGALFRLWPFVCLFVCLSRFLFLFLFFFVAVVVILAIVVYLFVAFYFCFAVAICSRNRLIIAYVAVLVGQSIFSSVLCIICDHQTVQSARIPETWTKKEKTRKQERRKKREGTEKQRERNFPVITAMRKQKEAISQTDSLGVTDLGPRIPLSPTRTRCDVKDAGGENRTTAVRTWPGQRVVHLGESAQHEVPFKNSGGGRQEN